MDSQPILVVDLDGSLIKTDLIYETFVRTIFRRPWLIFLIPSWLLKGIAYLKAQLAVFGEPDVSGLPFNSELLEWLQQEKRNGRTLVLATGSNQALADKIAEHLGIFSDVIGSSSSVNLTGTQKATALQEKYADTGFSYVGNERKDLKVWAKSTTAIVVCHDKSLKKSAESVCTVEQSFSVVPAGISTYIKAIRAHQWSKNALLFVPLLTAHKIFDVSLLINVCLAFLAFGLCASATYILNDLSDLDSDRKHWKKRFRPIASGALSIKSGFVLCGSMLIASALISVLFLPIWFLVVLSFYTVVTLGYSFWFKKLQTVDIVVLASLYTVRLFAGSAAINVEPSFWLLTFSMFIFLSLAIVKRISEILKKKEKDPAADKLSGRGYYVADLPVLMSLGSASGMVAILVFAMYVNSPATIELYHSPMILWAVCPIIGYWIIRVLIMTFRGEIDEDPISFAIRDRRSWVAGLAAFFVVLAAWQLQI